MPPIERETEKFERKTRFLRRKLGEFTPPLYIYYVTRVRISVNIGHDRRIWRRNITWISGNA